MMVDLFVMFIVPLYKRGATDLNQMKIKIKSHKSHKLILACMNSHELSQNQ
jgi:hypothetical protein